MSSNVICINSNSKKYIFPSVRRWLLTFYLFEVLNHKKLYAYSFIIHFKDYNLLILSFCRLPLLGIPFQIILIFFLDEYLILLIYKYNYNLSLTFESLDIH